MSSILKDKFRYHFEHPRYGFYLLLIGIMLLVAPVGSMYHIASHLLEIVYGAVLLVGPFLVSTSYRRWMFLTLLGLILFLLFIQEMRYGIFAILQPLLTLVFFTLTFFEIIRYVLQENEISVNTIMATICGYAILAIAAGPLFYILEVTNPGAFRLDGDVQFFDFIYFSFITVTTVGYGDIVPLHPLAKSLCIFIGFAGQLYLTIIMALIIGQYMSGRSDIS